MKAIPFPTYEERQHAEIDRLTWRLSCLHNERDALAAELALVSGALVTAQGWHATQDSRILALEAVQGHCIVHGECPQCRANRIIGDPRIGVLVGPPQAETKGEAPREIWACVSKGVSPHYVRFFESKSEMEAYECRDDSVTPNFYRFETASKPHMESQDDD
jgi:hypothetical protein